MARPANPLTMPRKHFSVERLALAIGIILIVATAMVYWRTLSADFVAWDDDINVYQNPHIQGVDGQRITWMFTNTQAALRYKPLSWLAWAAIYAHGGLNPFGFHLANVVLHCLNTSLVFLMLRVLLSGQSAVLPNLQMAQEPLIADAADGERKTRLRLLVAGWAALIWALHPLRVEPVAWVTGLPYGLSLCFLLFSFLFYLRPTPWFMMKNPVVSYWASVICFVLSLLSYPIGIAYPMVLVVLEGSRLHRRNAATTDKIDRKTFLKLIARQLPFWMSAGLILIVTLIGRIAAGGMWAKPATLMKFGLVERTMQAFYIWTCYLWKFWLPLDLSPVYTTLMSFNPWSFSFVGSALLVVTLTIWFSIRRWPLLLTLWICHLILLIPVLGLTEHPHFPSDRYCFVAAILWSVLLAAQFVRLLESRRPALVWVGALSMLLVFAVLSFTQVPVWQNSVSLFRHALKGNGEESPYYETLLTGLATAYNRQKNYAEALECYDELLRSNPNNLFAHQNMADILFDLHRFKEAQRHSEQILEIAPDNAANHNTLGVISLALGNSSKAVLHFRDALRIDPHLLSANQNLARVLAQQTGNEAAGGNSQSSAEVSTNNAPRH